MNSKLNVIIKFSILALREHSCWGGGLMRNIIGGDLRGKKGNVQKLEMFWGVGAT